ncbi:hypothetical protein POX_c03783 [Penicillium oxalicum]|uniref:hypothetical protein n=1 Tax=Penicillium oxalicum TaxID=69781 RepID=UPI0020B84D6D|nr:hypothetical protein POX_c03783 [Penicillium oxalicum]KAI2790931.1 hypothetical protein POX_c03783 [Penicillium oxalicum]
MASFNNMNHSPNAFWEHVASTLDDHPFFNSRNMHHPHPPPPPFWGWGNPSHPHRRHRGPPPSFWGWATQPDDQDLPRYTETPPSAGQSPEPTAGPSHSTAQTPKADQDKAASPEAETQNEDESHSHGRCGKGKHPAHGGPDGTGHQRRCGRGPHGRGGGRGRHHGGARPPFSPGPGFPNLEFLRNIASQFGVQFPEPTPEGVDFVPSVDVFDTPAKFIVHTSLPGAKKEDVSIDYDPAEATLHIAGVIYRPGVNEDLHHALVMQERAREVGVFQRDVHLGTHETPAVISVDEVTARLEEGVLIVTLPKVERKPEAKRKIIVEDGNISNEKDAMQVDVREDTVTETETMTPSTSDESDGEEGKTKEYVKVQVK